jgi:hypothetical protein
MVVVALNLRWHMDVATLDLSKCGALFVVQGVKSS